MLQMGKRRGWRRVLAREGGLTLTLTLTGTQHVGIRHCIAVREAAILAALWGHVIG